MNIRVQHDGYIIAGDFNSNISQIVGSMKANQIFKLMVDLKTISPIRLYNGPMRYTYVCEANDRFSLLDDIWVNFGQNNAISVQNVNILEDEDNFSDHCPVGCTLLIKGVNEPSKLNVYDCWYKYIWSGNAKADIIMKLVITYRNVCICLITVACIAVIVLLELIGAM